jgi:capsular polysaccharide export protein
MKIAILNNAANYLDFNVNLAKYFELFDIQTVFLNTDKFIKRQLQKNDLRVEDYPKLNNYESYYNQDSDIIKYFKRIYHIRDTKKLINQKDKEYSVSKNYFQQHNFDYVLILNGSFNVETDVCRDLRIKTFFFEHGYFPNTIQMDGKGVNCNAEFGNLSFEDFMRFKYDSNKFNVKKEFNLKKVEYNIFERYFFRILDPQYNTFLSKFIKRKKNLSSATKRFKNFNIENIDPEKQGDFILFPLQVNSDTQIILNSPFSSMYDAIEAILPALKKTGLKIIIKEHPMEVEPVDYSSFIDNEQVFLVTKIDLDKFIKASKFVVNINSSVGFQSIAQYKKVLTMGDSFYNNSPITVLQKDIKEQDLMQLIDSKTINKNQIDEYINHYTENIFIEGHFYKPTVEFLERIKNRLI